MMVSHGGFWNWFSVIPVALCEKIPLTEARGTRRICNIQTHRWQLVPHSKGEYGPTFSH